MRRFICLSAILLLTPVAATGQSLVLVPSPPVYHDGESADGLFIMQAGTELLLQQRARKGPDGKIYILMTIFDDARKTVARIIFDPLTFRQQTVTEDEISKTLESTCSPDALYPITLGKVYECSTTVEEKGGARTIFERMEFDEVHRDEHGGIVAYCNLVIDDDGATKVTSRMCSSLDGKWLRSVRVLNITVRQQT